MNLYKIAVPWLLAQFGVRKWLRDRALHVPAMVLPDLSTAAGVTPEQWRAVEATIAATLYEGVIVRNLP